MHERGSGQAESGTRERGWSGGDGGGGSLAAGGVEAQGRERAREIGQMTAPLEGSVLPSLFPLSHLLMLIFITLLKILIIN